MLQAPTGPPEGRFLDPKPYALSPKPIVGFRVSLTLNPRFSSSLRLYGPCLPPGFLLSLVTRQQLHGFEAVGFTVWGFVEV